MKKQEFIKLAAAILSKRITLGNTTSETACSLDVWENRIIITPDDGRIFFHMEEVVNLCTALELDSYVKFDEGKLQVHIF